VTWADLHPLPLQPQFDPACSQVIGLQVAE
jgi:hypothetical protein